MEVVIVGILGDLGFGGNVDVCVIIKIGVKLLWILSLFIEFVKRFGCYYFVFGIIVVLI